MQNEMIEEEIPTIEYVKGLEDQVKDEHNKYLMALADADNIRKNFLKKQADLYTYKYEDLMKELISIVDDAERAEDSGSLSEGSVLIFSKFGSILSKNGLRKIYPNTGDDFNSDTMEAVSLINAGDEMSGKIIDVTLAGYSYNGKIIRYPKVVVGQ